MATHSSSKRTWHPTRTRTAWLAIHDLTIDDRYERALSKPKVNKIAEDLDPDAFGNVIVSERDDGTFVIIDGQHRVEAVRKVWGDRNQVPCLIYMGLTVKEEARLFVQFNEVRTNPKPLAIFKAKVVAEDATALSVMKIVEKHGCAIGHGGISAVQALTRVHDFGGADVLDDTLYVIGAAWGVEPGAYKGDLINGIGLAISRYHSRIDLKRLIKTLTGNQPEQVIAKARFAKEAAITVSSRVSRNETTVAELVISLYNKGLRGDARRLVWEHRSAAYHWRDECSMPTSGGSRERDLD